MLIWILFDSAFDYKPKSGIYFSISNVNDHNSRWNRNTRLKRLIVLAGSLPGEAGLSKLQACASCPSLGHYTALPNLPRWMHRPSSWQYDSGGGEAPSSIRATWTDLNCIRRRCHDHRIAGIFKRKD